MELCDTGHPEVAYDADYCPVCSMDEKWREASLRLEEDIQALQIKCENKDDVIASLEEDIKNLKIESEG